MLHTYSAGASRRALVLTGILGLHFAVFLIVANERFIDTVQPKIDRTIIKVVPPKPIERNGPPPPVPGEYTPDVVPEPPIDIPRELEQPVTDDRVSVLQTGSGPDIAAAPDVVLAPTIAMRGSRLAALIDACYPPSSRRAGEEGKATVRLVIGANGKLESWQLLQGTGFPRLDSAIGCVVEALVFTAGSRNGSAVRAEAILPIVFRLN